MLVFTLYSERKKGFQVGFTVGLGFALIENLVYILSSGFFGAFNLTLTALTRGIGAILAHGLWTGISGFGIGYYLSLIHI